MPNRAWRPRIDTGVHELARRRARIDAEAAVTVAWQRFVQYARQLGIAAARENWGRE
jgi:hypothetical protein